MKVWGRGSTFWLAMLAVAAMVMASAAAADPPRVDYGVSSAKGCESPTFVGNKDFCFYTFTNITAVGANDVASTDTVLVTSAVDTVHAAGGDVSSGNILSQLGLVFAPAAGVGAPVCVGGAGAGTQVSPYVGATQCTLPYGASISSMDFGWYTTKPADFLQNASHKLSDQIDFTWFDLCDKTPSHDTCDPVTDNDVEAPASTILKQYTP